MRRAEYEREGFVIVRGVFSPREIADALADGERVEREFAHLKDTKNRRCRWQDNAFTGECQFDAFDPIIDLSPACASLARDPRMLDLIGELYGEPACLFKDKLIYKHPGAKGYGLHQDWVAWERFPRSFNSVLVPLDPADEANGCTIVYPGYHRDGPLTPADGNYRGLPSETVDESRAVPLVLKPGDVAVFGGYTPHRSNANLADRPRRQLYFSYTKFSEGGDLREQHYRDFQEWLIQKYDEHGKKGTYFA